MFEVAKDQISYGGPADHKRHWNRAAVSPFLRSVLVHRQLGNRCLPGSGHGCTEELFLKEALSAVTRVECTDLFLRYREVARLVWNLGFWPYPECREWASERAYDSGMARLFEGIILRPLGCGAIIEETFRPGVVAEFRVETPGREAELRINEQGPDQPYSVWGKPVIRIQEGTHQLRFMAFFDWQQLAPRDFRVLEVLIERLDERPDLVGHHALVEMDRCSISLIQSEESDLST